MRMIALEAPMLILANENKKVPLYLHKRMYNRFALFFCFGYGDWWERESDGYEYRGYQDNGGDWSLRSRAGNGGSIKILMMIGEDSGGRWWLKMRICWRRERRDWWWLRERAKRIRERGCVAFVMVAEMIERRRSWLLLVCYRVVMTIMVGDWKWERTKGKRVEWKMRKKKMRCVALVVIRFILHMFILHDSHGECVCRHGLANLSNANDMLIMYAHDAMVFTWENALLICYRFNISIPIITWFEIFGSRLIRTTIIWVGIFGGLMLIGCFMWQYLELRYTIQTDVASP